MTTPRGIGQPGPKPPKVVVPNETREILLDLRSSIEKANRIIETLSDLGIVMQVGIGQRIPDGKAPDDPRAAVPFIEHQPMIEVSS